jgi:hypothetical protein
MAEFDLVSLIKPVFAQSNTLQDGTTPSVAIDTAGWRSCSFLAILNASARFGDCSWSLTHSDAADGSYTAVPEVDVIFPRGGETSLERAFQAGYAGKKRWVKAAFECDGTTTVDLAFTSGAAAALTSISSSGTTATVTRTSHGLVAGQTVTIAGAAQAAYNGTFRIATVADANTFTYTMGGAAAASPATTTTALTVTPRVYWANNPGADVPATVSVGSAAKTGSYALTVKKVTAGSAAARVAPKSGNTGNGAATVSEIAAAAVALLGENIVATCTAVAANAGTFTVYRQDGTSLGTVAVGATGATLQVGGSNAFKLVVADGATDWAAGDQIDITITDVGVNVYTLTDPDGVVVGNPRGGAAFSSDHLAFTVPDSTVAVSAANAALTIAVERGLAVGDIVALLGHPVSGPTYQDGIQGFEDS